MKPWPIEIDRQFGCWLWRGKVNSGGYAIVWRGRRPSDAHKLVYEAERGAVPEGMTLDHRCKRRLCVNPEHLDPMSNLANQQGKSWRARVRRQADCSRGHEMPLNVMVTPEGGRLCRACVRNDLASDRLTGGYTRADPRL